MVARRAHNPKVVGSNPAPATTLLEPLLRGFLLCVIRYLQHRITLVYFIQKIK